MTQAIDITKPELIAWLQEKQAEAAKFDAANAKAHKADEKAWHKATKAQFAELAKIKTYEEMRDAIFPADDMGYRRRGQGSASIEALPTCDRLREPAYAKAIEWVERDKKTAFVLSAKGKHSHLWILVNHDFWPAAETVCD